LWGSGAPNFEILILNPYGSRRAGLMDETTEESRETGIEKAPVVKPSNRDWKASVAFAVSTIAVVISGLSAYYASVQSEYSRIQAENSRIQAESGRLQSEHSRIQAEIVSQNNLPNIDVTQETETDGKDQADTYSITISNEGGPLSEFSSKGVTFLYVMILDASQGYPILADIPLVAFYGDHVLTGRAKGVVCRFRGGDITKYNQLTKALVRCHEEAYPDGKVKLSTDLMTYLRVRYRDVLGNSHIDYLSVQPGRDMQRIESKDWNSLYQKRSLDMRTANGEDLRQIYSEVISKSIPHK
jgi:hypothetical protein